MIAPNVARKTTSAVPPNPLEGLLFTCVCVEGLTPFFSNFYRESAHGLVGRPVRVGSSENEQPPDSLPKTLTSMRPARARRASPSAEREPRGACPRLACAASCSRTGPIVAVVRVLAPSASQQVAFARRAGGTSGFSRRGCTPRPGHRRLHADRSCYGHATVCRRQTSATQPACRRSE